MNARIGGQPEGAEVGGDFLLIADQMQLGQLAVLRKRQHRAVNDHSTAMVTAHDIHCDAHK